MARLDIPGNPSHPEGPRTPMIKLLCRAAAIAVPILFAVSVASAEELIGTWLTQEKDAHIRVAKCGNAMCGTVAWLRDAIDPKTGQPPVDDKNPNASLRSRKNLGIRIFAMEQDASGAWTGDIYNSDDGKNYKGRLAPRGEDEMEVQGCADSLCGSEVWTRAK
jgi:uncharacterized protein (DUF2147 family)